MNEGSSVRKISRWKKSSQSKVFNRCLLAARTLPIERFHLPDDSRRQWRGVARSRAAVLEHLASRANADGTFLRDGRDYSPNAEKLQERFGECTFYRRVNELRDLGLLIWVRPNRQLKRSYRILLENFYWNADQIAEFYVRPDLSHSNPDLSPETLLTYHLRHSADVSDSGLNANKKR
jgi:hypothetical protein